MKEVTLADLVIASYPHGFKEPKSATVQSLMEKAMNAWGLDKPQGQQ